MLQAAAPKPSLSQPRCHVSVSRQTSALQVLPSRPTRRWPLRSRRTLTKPCYTRQKMHICSLTWQQRRQWWVPSTPNRIWVLLEPPNTMKVNSRMLGRNKHCNQIETLPGSHPDDPGPSSLTRVGVMGCGDAGLRVRPSTQPRIILPLAFSGSSFSGSSRPWPGLSLKCRASPPFPMYDFSHV